MKRLKNNKGMTLVELVVAFIMLMSVIIGFSIFFTQSLMWSIRAERQTANFAAAKGVSDNVLADFRRTVEANSSLAYDADFSVTDFTNADEVEYEIIYHNGIDTESSSDLGMPEVRSIYVKIWGEGAPPNNYLYETESFTNGTTYYILGVDP